VGILIDETCSARRALEGSVLQSVHGRQFGTRDYDGRGFNLFPDRSDALFRDSYWLGAR